MWADREEELDGLADADDKPLHLLDFDTPEEFMNPYSRRCDRWRERFDRAKEKVDRKASLHNKPVAESEIDAIRSAGPNPCEAINCCKVVRAVPCRMPNAKPTSAAAFIIFSVEASPIHQLAAVSSTFGKRVSKRSVLSISPAGISPGLP